MFGGGRGADLGLRYRCAAFPATCLPSRRPLRGSPRANLQPGLNLMRGSKKARAEFSPTALAYNLRRVLIIVGFAELMAAVAA
jgi:hypothetical protein